MGVHCRTQFNIPKVMFQTNVEAHFGEFEIQVKWTGPEQAKELEFSGTYQLLVWTHYAVLLLENVNIIKENTEPVVSFSRETSLEANAKKTK